MFARRYAKLQGDQLKNIFTTRRRIIIAGITTAAVLGTGGAAFAYFAASGTGTGSATVGAAGTWMVSPATAKGGPLYPDGTSTETIVFTVTNGSSGDQEFTSASAAVAQDTNGYATSGGVSISGCYAGWFNASIANPATDDPDINTEIAAGKSAKIMVTVTMPADTKDNQTACADKSPDITLNIA
jgi:hypothetical protein